MGWKGYVVTVKGVLVDEGEKTSAREHLPGGDRTKEAGGFGQKGKGSMLGPKNRGGGGQGRSNSRQGQVVSKKGCQGHWKKKNTSTSGRRLPNIRKSDFERTKRGTARREGQGVQG